MSTDTTSFDTTPLDPAGTPSAEPRRAEPCAPRIRWAAIVWGAFFATTAALGLWLHIDPVRRHDLADWAMTQTPASITASVLLMIGTLVLVGGAAGLIRHSQRRRAQ